MFKLDAILVNDEYFDFEIAKSSGSVIAKNTINFDSLEQLTLCGYYGKKLLKNFNDIYFQDLSCCTFADLINNGQGSCTPCNQFNLEFQYLTNVTIDQLDECTFLDLQ